MLPEFLPRAFWSLITLLSLTNLAHAFDPVLSTVTPRGGQAGQQVEVTFHGDRLDEVEEVLFYRPGITVSDLKNENSKRAKGAFKIAADAPLGEHPFRVRTKQGVTYQRTFWVGAFPTVTEKTSYDEKRKRTNEENDTFEAPQRIELNHIVHGIARKEDADYYVFSGKKGQRVTAEVFGMRLGREVFDPYLAILDSKRFELATCDDHVLNKRDPFVSIVLPEDGDYTLLLRESSYQGNDNSNYLLQVSESPRPTSVHPPVGQPGQKLELTFKGDAAGESKQLVTLPYTPGLASIYANVNGKSAPSPNQVLLTPHPILGETEPNNQQGLAKKQKPAALPVTLHGVIDKQDDVDWFLFSAKKGQDIRVQVHARALRSPLDPVIQVRNAKDNKNLGNSDDDGNNPDSKFDFKAPEDGEYFLMIRDHLNRGGPDFTYTIELAARTPSLRAELPYASNNDSQKHRMITIPRGNHLAIVPNVARQNTNCDVVLEHDRLPKGVTMKSEVAPRSPVNFPILFSAAADAPLGATLSRFTIKDTKSELRGPFEENIHHIEINNAGPLHSTHNERLAISVIEEAPFHLEIVAPPVPLVRSGTMDLVVRAKRAEGFTKAIKVKLPWRPAGVGAPPEVSIPEGKSEAIIPINANGDAPLRTSSICVTGESNPGNGNVRVSSPFVTLEVAEPYLNGSIDLATSEVGKDVALLCELETLRPFEGEAELTLHSLPHKVTAAPIKIKASDKSIKIPLTIPADVKPGKSKSIFAQVLIKQGNHVIPHQIAQGTTLVITPKPAEVTAKK
ncbi:PPC domain-containing protein [Roseibacillus persicicus]|uniref:Serine protease n=1 Tax=Roseibacillus persicicus TaxID=454148 RepID=A0A918WFU9_9BACT|nr:PPC domain-containing protein [Roseibacillus persicicus]GHC40214.1 serine protease [Roseibacillus persicicus]